MTRADVVIGRRSSSRSEHTLVCGIGRAAAAPRARVQRVQDQRGFVDTTRHRDADASGGLISTTADLDRFFTALLGGELLRPAQLAEMRKTVPVATELRRVWPGARYGLGLI
ncbi:serine hydrolase [Nonomuraea sp. NPDC052116]|uniref:serine hydrolase n=1 Tax=Nonomuraea sp. NPDC052116 TaxID=3155665 RepID=UPI00342A20BB